ncbi:alpha-galactosidase [Bifidobacterium phasiani]|uniref:Alpha-galactosidase n=1 Tax=Bifidobacterium phasiani TaxID=2834431 RepID=A0ABS6W6Y8_9BIFI|nr:alpha-galactosidase [Bifidobacterium phasiani]MBW3082245.1 alpha-galactosidase [Bifidobacterium phasiani]
MLFPATPTAEPTTRIVLADARRGDGLPAVLAIAPCADPARLAALPVQSPRRTTLLPEHATGRYGRPALRGHRILAGGPGSPAAGLDWTTRFVLDADPTVDGDALTIRAGDADAGLALCTRIEAMPGGALRIRHSLTNTAAGDYLLEGLEVAVPLRDDQTEFIDFTGRHENERQPQRHRVADGTWLREGRRGKTGFEGAELIAGTPGFSFGSGSVIDVQPAFSGNTVLGVDRIAEDGAVVFAGELLLPGEVLLAPGETYTMPWVVVTASDRGMDGAMQVLHAWERSLPAHPAEQPVTLNVWEALYFDQRPDVVLDLVERAARLGIERFVLDDGWFHLRRSDHAGLGDWWVDRDVWPDGLRPLADAVHAHGMQFGLWFEPEMVNPDSDLCRAHPDWVLRPDGRMPLPYRHQQVLDLTNPDAFAHVFEAISAVLGECGVDYVKWDHNRDLLEAGSTPRGGAPAVHDHTVGYYRLLDALRERFPRIAWESCASGGGRVDLGVVEHVSRVWTSDMTDALSRQRIQRGMVQSVAPEYLGAHVSATTSHQTGRTYTLAFRAATAVFGAFGIEWDIRQADAADLDELAQWIAWYKAERGFLHSGRVVRLDVADPAVLAHGVVAADRSRAIVAHVQYEESSSNRGVWLRVPGLDPDARYALRWAGPHPAGDASRPDWDPILPGGPLGDDFSTTMTGAALATIGVRIPRCRPETIRLIEFSRV